MFKKTTLHKIKSYTLLLLPNNNKTIHIQSCI